MNADQTQLDPKEMEDYSISERRLWSAVLLQAIEDWRSTNVRRSKEAAKFFFGNTGDLMTVCRGAGLEPTYVTRKLAEMQA